MSERSSRSNSIPGDQDYLKFNNDGFLRELEADLNESSLPLDNWPQLISPRITVEPRKVDCIARPRLSNKFMLKGLVEHTQDYNKKVDRRVMTDARIAFEEEQLKNVNAVKNGIENLTVSSQHIAKRGRGENFGKLRSLETGSEFPPRPSTHSLGFSNYTKSNPTDRQVNCTPPIASPEGNFFETGDEGNRSLRLQTLCRSGLNSRTSQPGNDPPAKRHTFNPATAYNGKVKPDYRFNYNPNTPPPPLSVKYSLPEVVEPIKQISPVRPGQRYPKRPQNSPTVRSAPKQLNHNYYNIELYGATQEERIAQRIERTVRQTESPPERF